jgi:hypothetical protein
MSKNKFTSMRKRRLPKSIIECLDCSNLPPHVIELIRKMLVQSELSNDNLERCDCPSLQKELENSILGAEHDRNRKPLESNGQQIVIQIPNNLKVASIQIQFEQEKPQYRANSLASRF